MERKNDIAVALIFFNRPAPLRKVFDALRLSRPSKLFLIQDGARVNNVKDEENIVACRKIVENVDWDCEVFRNFSEENLSCDHRIITGISWAFEHVDRLVVLEDDCIPSESFLPFCADLLERYKLDLRVHMISGMNYLNVLENIDDSYFFSQTAAGWGWATWKRSWELAMAQKNFDYLEDKPTLKLITEYADQSNTIAGINNLVEITKRTRELNLITSRFNSWEYSLGIAMFLSSSMVITPQKNLISNIGLTDDSTHAVNSIKKINKASQNLFFKEVYKLDFPLKHPKYMVRNFHYEKEHLKLVGSNKYVLFLRKIESLLRRLYYSSSSERKLLIRKFLKK